MLRPDNTPSLTVGLLPRRDSLHTPLVEIEFIVHNAEEGGYWAEVPAIPGCATQSEKFDEFIRNLDEVIQGCVESV